MGSWYHACMTTAPVSLVSLAVSGDLDALRRALAELPDPELASTTIAMATNVAAQNGLLDSVEILLPHCPANAVPSMLAAPAQSGSVSILRLVAPVATHEARGEALRMAAMSGRRSCVDFLAPLSDAAYIATVLTRQGFGCVDFLAPHLTLAELRAVDEALPNVELEEIRERLRVHASASSLEESTPTAPGRRSTRL